MYVYMEILTQKNDLNIFVCVTDFNVSGAFNWRK